jgi:hypothetical protein
MQSLELALFIVMLELTVGSFASLAFLDMRRDTSRGFVVFQGSLYLIFALLTVLAMNGFATPELVRGFGLDDRWVHIQGPVVLAFLLLMIPWNILLWADRPPEGAKTGKRVLGPVSAKTKARFALGWLITLVGFASLFVDGMAYRSLADSHFGGAFVVAAFVCGGLALGGVMTAMLLGHWYLNTPTASGKPLEFATTLMLAALALELIFSLFIGNSTARPTLQTQIINPGTTIVVQGGHVVVSTPTPAPAKAGQQGQASQSGTDAKNAQAVAAQNVRQAPLTTGAMWWLEFVLGFAAPLVLDGVALYLTRGRSFQSATGMLYLCLAFVFIGEILGRGLLVAPIFS